MTNFLKYIEDKMINGGELEFDEACNLFYINDSEILYLFHIANYIRIKHCGNKVHLCYIVNAKSGLCPEDCHFCAQSMHYTTNCQTYPLLSAEEIFERYLQAKKLNARKFCIVTSGRLISDDEFESVINIVKTLKSNNGEIELDCSLGSLDDKRANILKDNSISTYNHNLETSKSYFKKICTTHEYEDRVKTAMIVKSHGIKLCCGGIIGMGENIRQRIELAFELKKMNPDYVPVNILNPRPGTPLQNMPPLPPIEILKTIAIFRLILKTPTIIVAGGREVNLRDLQALALLSGANGLIIGGYLTTKGREPELDFKMLSDLGLEF